MSKAGIMVKESTTPGSQYASVAATASHGVQMQYNFTHSAAGSAGTVSAASPQWLRPTRSGDTLTGYESGLPSTVQVGLFVASPMAQLVKGADNVRFVPTQAEATFDSLGLPGQ